MTRELVQERHPASGRGVTFSEDYYRKVVAQFGYNDFDLSHFRAGLAGIHPSELNTRWLCHHRAEDFEAAAGDRVVTTGFGMSGAPHMGTVGQILGVIRFQRAGERCQIVLGDLDAHNGKGLPLSRTRETAARFTEFARRLGFDDRHGVLRTQFDDMECLRNLYLLGHHATDEDFDSSEEDNHAYYAQLGIVDQDMTFRRKLSLALMAADFVTLGQQAGAVLVLLGIDEHPYVRFTTELVGRLPADGPLHGRFRLSAIYSRLVSGFGGHPKMSKSIPGSSITVESSADEIRSLIMRDPGRTPETSPAYQIICHALLRPPEVCTALAFEMTYGTPSWRRAQMDLTDYLVSVAELW